MNQTVVDVMGWAGAVLYLVAYWLVSMNKVGASSKEYQGLNIVAGVLIIVNTYYLKAYPSFGLNIVWVGIAVLTLVKKYYQK